MKKSFEEMAAAVGSPLPSGLLAGSPTLDPAARKRKRRRKPSRPEDVAFDCPECGHEKLILPHVRARYDDENGDEVEHKYTCRCRWCDWMWHDSGDPIQCPSCGIWVGVGVDASEERAYAEERLPPSLGDESGSFPNPGKV